MYISLLKNGVCMCVCVRVSQETIHSLMSTILNHIDPCAADPLPQGRRKNPSMGQNDWLSTCLNYFSLWTHLYKHPPYSTPSKNRDVIAYFTTIVVGPYSSISGACYTWWSHLIFSSHLRRWWSQDLACHTVDTSWRGNSSLFSTHPQKKKKVPEMAILT